MDPALVEVPYEGRTIRIEYAWVTPRRDDKDEPLVVFLHEGLGSLSMWKDWPAQLCAAGGYRGLVYSRYGYGNSMPRLVHRGYAGAHALPGARDPGPRRRIWHARAGGRHPRAGAGCRAGGARGVRSLAASRSTGQVAPRRDRFHKPPRRGARQRRRN